MRVSTAILFCFFLSSCYFGGNESSKEIINDCYLARWDSNTWISYSKDGKGVWDTENIIVGHNVFAVGDFGGFIIAKQHPCENQAPHIQDYDSLKPDLTITNYVIIDTRNESYEVQRFDKVDVDSPIFRTGYRQI